MADNQELIPGTPGTGSVSTTPQFSTAEYAHVPGTDRCRICGNLISGEYYRVNTQMACAKCAAEARDGQPSDTHSAFARALLVGAGAAFIGLVIYATFAIVTGITIGYLALAVGWLVAKGMMKASNGVGGTRYQIAAVLLTYIAISMSSIPVIISYAVKRSHARQAQAAQQLQSSANPTSDASAAQGAAPSPGSATTTAPTSRPRPRMGFVAALGYLALIGLASPFLELQSPGNGILGLLILFVGLSIAFRLTAAKPLSVDGPYAVTG